MNSLVIPVYKNEASVHALLAALADLHRDLGGDLDVVLVVDGSPDRCAELLRDGLAQTPDHRCLEGWLRLIPEICNSASRTKESLAGDGDDGLMLCLSLY